MSQSLNVSPCNVNSPSMVDYLRTLHGPDQAKTKGEILIGNDPDRAMVEASLVNKRSRFARRYREQTQDYETSIKQVLAK
eukprot:12060203-Heterocapsa_arctica.AAC.1